MSKADITSIKVPIRIRSSHNISERGFSSNLTSHFSSLLPGDEICWEPHFAASQMTILSVEVSEIAVGAPENDEQTLVVRFARPQDDETVDRFLQDLAVGLSVSMAQGQKDGWHGILFAEIPLAAVKHERLPSQGGGIIVTDAMSMEIRSPKPLSAKILKDLRASPLAEIFVDGMKAPDIKAKFIYWFVMLEELERLSEFDTLFERVFDAGDVDALVAAGNLTGVQRDRFKGWANGRNLTVQGRTEKLRSILHKIGISQIDTLQGDVAITTELIRSLIEQRNKVAHRGSKIDDSAVYTVLFPLAYHALIYLLNREQAQA